MPITVTATLTGEELVIRRANGAEVSETTIRGALQIERHMRDPEIAAAVAKLAQAKRDQVAAMQDAVIVAETAPDPDPAP